MTLTPVQTLIMIGMATLATMITRFLPFLLFRKPSAKRSYITYLGKVLPYAAIGLLVVYCLKGVTVTRMPYGIPEAVAIVCIAALHWWKGNTLLSIGAGTCIYIVLLQTIFK
jgi:branched-subunit amino acid transport protein AzlD